MGGTRPAPTQSVGAGFGMTLQGWLSVLALGSEATARLFGPSYLQRGFRDVVWALSGAPGSAAESK
jgi:hypothetical protein